MELGDEDKEFLRQLAWLYPADFMVEIRQMAEALVQEQLTAGERQNIREIVATIMARLQREAEGETDAQDEADTAAKQAAEEAVREKVLSALGNGEIHLPAGMGPEVIRPLVDALNGGESGIAGQAWQALRRLTDGGAIDRLCQLWADTRQPELESLLLAAGYLASRPLRLRLLTVLKNGADRSMLREGPELIPELLLAVDDADRTIAGRARRLLLTLTNRQAIDAVCEAVLAHREGRLKNWAVIARYTPAADTRAALYYCITGQWNRYYALDWQETRPLLAKAYSEATAAERQQFLAAARQGGQSLLLAGLLLEGGCRADYEEITDEDWSSMLDVLTGQERWPELFRLALRAPVNWAAELVLALGNATWRPKPWECADWERILSGCPASGKNLFVPDGRPLIDLEAPDVPVLLECAAFHPNGRLVAGGGSDGRLRLWQIAGGKLWRTVNLHDEGITAVAFTPDGRYLVTAGRDAKVQFWQFPEIKWVSSIKGQPGLVIALAADPGGQILALACAGGVAPAKAWAWDGANMTMQAHYPGSLFCAAAVSLEQRVVAGGGRDGRVRTYSLTGGKLGNKFWTAHSGPVQRLFSSKDGQVIVSRGEDNIIKVWRADRGQLLWNFRDEGRLLTVDQNGTLALLQSPQGLLTVRQMRFSKPLAAAKHEDWRHTAAILTSLELEPETRQAAVFLHSLLALKFRYDIML